MKIKLFNQNNDPITNWLDELFDSRMVCIDDDVDLLPIGTIIDCDNYQIVGLDIYNGDLLVNKNSLVNIIVSDHYVGCCGHCGETINIFDENSKDIGFEYNDCWMSHFVRIPKSNVIIKKENSEFFEKNR